MSQTVTTKLCTGCDEDKPLSAFYRKSPQNGGGYQSKCGQCVMARQKELNSRRTFETPTDKPCTKCSQVKVPADFYKNSASRDGLGPWCKSCMDERKKENTANNRERTLAGQRRRYERPEYKQKKREYSDKHPEVNREATRRYTQKNPEVRLRNYQIRRARKAGALVEPVDRTTVYLRDQGLCGVCGNGVLFEDMHLDHKVPLSKNGEHSYANTQTTHGLCNRRKSDKLVA